MYARQTLYLLDTYEVLQQKYNWYNIRKHDAFFYASSSSIDYASKCENANGGDIEPYARRNEGKSTNMLRQIFF